MRNRDKNFLRILSLFIFVAIPLIGCSESNKNNQIGNGGFPGFSGTSGGGAVGGQAGSTPMVTGGTGGIGGTAGTGGRPLPMDSGAPDGSAGTSGSPSADTGTGGLANLDGSTDSSTEAGGDSNIVAEAGTDSGSKQTLPPITDYTQAGPFKTTTEANVGPNNGYTIFRPDPLGENRFLHSPIVFGPGILTTASMYTNLLDHLASHGFVTICVNSMSGGPNDPGNLQAMQTGLEWLIAQNSQAGVYQGKLAVDRAIGMGYSIGATASTQLSSHPAIMTTVSIHGHNTSGDPHGPVLLLTGTNDVIDDNRATLATLEEAPAILAALPIGHLDVLNEAAMLAPISASTRYIAPITGWLRYWVNGDQDAKRFFWGADCEMCKSPWITPETNDKWKAQTL